MFSFVSLLARSFPGRCNIIPWSRSKKSEITNSPVCHLPLYITPDRLSLLLKLSSVFLVQINGVTCYASNSTSVHKYHVGHLKEALVELQRRSREVWCSVGMNSSNKVLRSRELHFPLVTRLFTKLGLVSYDSEQPYVLFGLSPTGFPHYFPMSSLLKGHDEQRICLSWRSLRSHYHVQLCWKLSSLPLLPKREMRALLFTCLCPLGVGIVCTAIVPIHLTMRFDDLKPRAKNLRILPCRLFSVMTLWSFGLDGRQSVSQDVHLLPHLFFLSTLAASALSETKLLKSLVWTLIRASAIFASISQSCSESVETEVQSHDGSEVSVPRHSNTFLCWESI